MQAKAFNPLKVMVAASVLIRRPGDAVSLIVKQLRNLGPYLLIELILPGGTLIAVSMYLYQHRRSVLRTASVD